MEGTVTEPQPWACSRCGTRLLWRRASLDCPVHGTVAALPKWPADRDDAGGSLTK